MPEQPITTRSRSIQVLLLGTALAWPAAAIAQNAPASLPPLMVPTSNEHHRGKMVLAELVTPDLAAAERFYGGLFGWGFQADPAHPTYAQASLDGQVVAAIVQRPLPAGRQPAWLTFLATSDVTETDQAATQLGAKILRQPRQLAALGEGSVLADPQGGVFGILSSPSGDSPDLLAEPGMWIWSSLITSDPIADATFYKSLLGYDVFQLPNPEDAQHLILASDSYARASVNPIPPGWLPGRPRWLSYVRVDDVAGMAAKATTLGGHVVVEPRVDRHGGRIAVVADPAGALFGLMEWQQDGSVGKAK